MKEEIIKRLKDSLDYEFELSFKDRKQLLDYITNLQQENKILKENAEHNDKVVDKARWNEMIYKSRNEKAIEYIMTELITEWDIKNDGCVSGSDLPADAITPLLNILNGSDEK